MSHPTLRSVVGRHGLGALGARSSGQWRDPRSLTFPGVGSGQDALPWSICLTLPRFPCSPREFLLTGGTPGAPGVCGTGQGLCAPVGPPDPDSLLMLGLSQHPVRRLEQETGVQKGGG